MIWKFGFFHLTLLKETIKTFIMYLEARMARIFMKLEEVMIKEISLSLPLPLSLSLLLSLSLSLSFALYIYHKTSSCTASYESNIYYNISTSQLSLSLSLLQNDFINHYLSSLTWIYPSLFLSLLSFILSFFSLSISPSLSLSIYPSLSIYLSIILHISFFLIHITSK